MRASRRAINRFASLSRDNDRLHQMPLRPSKIGHSRRLIDPYAITSLEALTRSGIFKGITIAEFRFKRDRGQSDEVGIEYSAD